MNYDFESYLFEKLSHIAIELNYTDVNIYVSEEQNFAKMDKLTPDSIYIVVKYLSSNIEYYTETLPIQILVLSEQNSLEKAQMIMNKFANDYNWQVIIDGNTYIKQQYNSPVVLNNYVEVGYGYRSVLYATGTLYVMENVVDVTDVKIDNADIKPLSFSINYSMSTNTQQLPSEEIASSLKTVSTFAITMTVPMVTSNVVNKIIGILNEGINGNTPFKLSFKCGTATIEKLEMRLISAQITTAPNQVPGLQLGFMK